MPLGVAPSAPATSSEPPSAAAAERVGDLPAEQWPDACSLLALPDAAPGAPAELADGSTTPGAATCTWGSGADEVVLEVRQVVYDVRAAFAALRAGVPSQVPVEGVGQAAFDPGVGPPTVIACSGRTIYVVELPGASGPDADERVVALAREAASRVTGPAGEVP